MKNSLPLLVLLAFVIQSPYLAHAAARQVVAEMRHYQVTCGKVPGNFYKTRKEVKKAEKQKKRLARKLDKWKNKVRFDGRISLAWIGILVMVLGALFIVLGLVIPYVGLLFLVLGIIIAFAGLLLTLLPGGLSVGSV